MTIAVKIRRALAGATVLCLIAQTGLAAPASSESATIEADSHTQKAIDAFGAGRYDEAIAEFEAAFELDHNPNHLFNIGRVHEEVGDLQAAVDLYKRFVAQPGVQIDYRAAALERIDVLERALAAQREADEPAPAPEPAPESSPEPVLAPTTDTVDEDAAARRKTQRSAGWALLGIGGATLIAGAVTTGLTASTSNELAETSDPDERETLADRGRTLAPTSDGLMIAGGTLALVGLIVALTALPKRSERRTAALPYAGPSSAGLVLMRRF
ncbi:tetratricopeptide repeat protein [Nannocystaceae bacterium ST9]